MHNGKKIGLALSGGGVRAAAFHLGVLDKLEELEILEKIDVISTVSGGSIIGAFYMLHKNNFKSFKNLMIQKLQKSIQLRIILNWRMLWAFLSPFYSRTDVKTHIYSKLYFDNNTFAILEQYPKLIINATNLATGKNWRFSQEYMGDWKTGKNGFTNVLKIADAVAASSAVPLIFYPKKIKLDKYFDNTKTKLKKIALSDGGVYDNQGLHSLTSDFENNTKCDYIICSDASFPFDTEPTKVPFRFINVARRQSKIMMDRIKNLQFQDLLYGKYKDTIKSAYFSINWHIEELLRKLNQQHELCKKLNIHEIFKDPIYQKNINDCVFKTDAELIKKLKQVLNYPELENYLNTDNVKFVSSIGTSLKALSEKELNLLIQHGKTLCGFQVRTYLPELIK